MNCIRRFSAGCVNISEAKVLSEKTYEEKELVADLQQAILDENINSIDQSINNLLSTDFDITKIWQQVLSRFDPESTPQIEAKTYYKISVLKKELESQDIDPMHNDALYKICTIAEAKLAECAEEQPPLVIKKGTNELDHTLLIDFQNRTFTVCGVGPIKTEGGFCKVRSAIEVALKQEEGEPFESIAATYVVRKTNLPGATIAQREIDKERLFGDLRTLAFYGEENGSPRTTFSTEAYQMDLIDLNNKQILLTFSERLQILGCIATQLEFMHEDHDTIHNDLKPDNVLFRRNKNGGVEAKIADFGHSYSPLRREAAYFPNSYGTIEYTAPELVEDPQRAYSLSEKKAQDIYAFGCIAYGLKHRSHPDWFEDIVRALAEKDETARNKALRKQHEIAGATDFDPETAEDSFDLLMYRMLHPDPVERITVQEVCRAIDEITAQLIAQERVDRLRLEF